MVERLELETTDHPSPYKVSWLQKGHQVNVTKQCLVDIKIGGYNDKILCDVIPIDVYHLLLGRPWQYDRNVIHDGKKIHIPWRGMGELICCVQLNIKG
jgi:hypothetical protein